jgi:FtsH-binding integral membrane protein
LASDLSELPVKDGFRLRGESISRLETFVDAAFAFAVTMMVISVGAIPNSVADLLFALRKVPTMTVCFLIMMMFWSSHNRWSRRFGLDTWRTSALSLGLVLGVLVWVYPQRLVMGAALSFMTGGWVPAEINPSSVGEMQDAMLVYGLGFAWLSAVLMQLDREALAAADELQLDSLERLETRRDMGSHGVLLVIAIVSIVLTFVVRGLEGWAASVSGFVYCAIGPAMHFHHARYHKLRKALPPRIA